MKRFKAARHFGRKIALVAGSSTALAIAAVGQAHADAAAAAAAIPATGTDVETIGYAALGLLVVAAMFKYMRRAV